MPAADLSEQISTAGMEASGTGNMKMALNGALTVGTLDAANVEMHDMVGDDNIFIFGLTAAEVEAARARGINSTEHIAALPILREALDEIASGVFSTDDAARYRGLVDTLTHHDYFMICADFDATGGADENRPSLARSEPMDAFERSQQGQCRLVLLRSNDRRICKGNLECALRADKLSPSHGDRHGGGMESAGPRPRRDRGCAQFRSFRRARAASDGRWMGHPGLCA